MNPRFRGVGHRQRLPAASRVVATEGAPHRGTDRAGPRGHGPAGRRAPPAGRRVVGAARPPPARAAAGTALAAAADAHRDAVHLRLRGGPRRHLADRGPGAALPGVRPLSGLQHRCRPPGALARGGAAGQRAVDRGRGPLAVLARVRPGADRAGTARRRGAGGLCLPGRACAGHPGDGGPGRPRGAGRPAAGDLPAPPRLRHQLRCRREHRRPGGPVAPLAPLAPPPRHGGPPAGRPPRLYGSDDRLGPSDRPGDRHGRLALRTPLGAFSPTRPGGRGTARPVVTRPPPTCGVP
ncbi:hypothetical protein SGPA1_11824 [Streptomyces misionensis JCM 4497]